MDSFVNETFSLLAVGIVVVAFRSASRLWTVGIQGLWADDYLMVLAVVVYALETATAYAVGAWWHGLANNGMTDLQRQTLAPDTQEYRFRVNGSKTQLVGWSLYTLLLWLLKLCMCIFYDRLTQSLDYMKLRIRIGYTIIAVTYIVTICSILGGCHPFHHNWQIFPNPGNHCQPAISRIDLYVTVILNVLSDAYLLSIPLPLLWKADLPLTKRLSLICIFSGAIFVMAAAILRCALVIEDPIGGAQAAGSWAVRETFVAVVVANLPIVYQGFRKMMARSSNGTGASRQSGGSSNIFSRLRNRLSASSYSDYKHKYKRSKDSQLSQSGEGPQDSLNMHPLSSAYPHLQHGGDDGTHANINPEGDADIPAEEIVVGYKNDFGEPFGASYWKQQHGHDPNSHEESVEPVHMLPLSKAHLRN